MLRFPLLFHWSRGYSNPSPPDEESFVRDLACLLLSLDIMRGSIFEIRALRLGREAQIIATLHSTADQEAAPMLSSVLFIC
jgi:hypothetical protein